MYGQKCNEVILEIKANHKIHTSEVEVHTY